MPTIRHTTGALLVAIAFASTLAACRTEEQDRPLQYTPGVYQGEKTQPLDDSKRRELRERGLLQG